MLEEKEFIILSALYGQVVMWQGHYGWADVEEVEAWAINRARRYTDGGAKRALARLKSAHRNSRLWRNARVYRLADLWVVPGDPNARAVNWALLAAIDPPRPPRSE